MRGDAVELLPAKGTDAAIVVRLDLESRWSEWQRRKLGDRPRRQERDHYAITSDVQAGEAGRAGEKNMRKGSQLRLSQDNFAFGEVGNLQHGYKVRLVEIRKP